jgi:monoamine oxidase
MIIVKSHQISVVLSSILLLFQSQVSLAATKKHGSEKPVSVEVAIIGGGLSGLTAAYRLGALADELIDQNILLKIKVYEARKRLGGRVFTAIINKTPVELGGQYLEDGGAAKEIRQLIGDLELKTTTFHRPSRTYYFHESAGKNSFSQAKPVRIYDDVMPKIHRISSDKDKQELIDFLKSLAQKHHTMDEVLNDFFETKRQKSFAEGNVARADAYNVLKDYYYARIMTYESLPASELASTYATGSFLKFFLRMENDYHEILEAKKRNGINRGIEMSSYKATSVEGGNAKLVEALEKRIVSETSEICFEMPLTELTRESNESYSLTFKNGQTARADIVVLTIPTPVYRKVKFVGTPIPEVQLADIKKIKYGPVGKIQIPIKNQQADEMIGSVFTSDMLTWFNWDFVRDHDNPNSVITLYFTGNGKILKIPFDQINRCKESIRPSRLGLEFEADQRFEAEIAAVKTAFPTLSLPLAEKAMVIQAPLEKQFVYSSNPLGVNWTIEEYSLGGYSVISSEQSSFFTPEQLKDSLGEKVFKVFEPVLPKIGNGKCAYCGLYFAGEHTATQGTPATMEGAVHSGNKVSRQIPRRLREVKSQLEKNYSYPPMSVMSLPNCLGLIPNLRAISADAPVCDSQIGSSSTSKSPLTFL